MKMIKQRKKLHMIFILEFALVCILSTSAKSEEEKKRYNYDFEVQPVDRCPMNESDWKAAAIRVGCNATHGYHCVPDRFHSTLIEFCYTSPRIMIAKGNCVELAAYGVLNNVKCENFNEGCPATPYLSDEIYKYPVCLNLALQCFTSNKNCLYQKFSNLQLLTDFTEVENNQDDTKFYIFLSLFVVCCAILSIAVLLYCCKSGKCNYKTKKHLEDIQEKETIPLENLRKRSSTRLSGDTEEKETLIAVQGKPQEDTTDSIDSGQQHESTFPSDLQVQLEIESELTYDDIYLSLLLRRHCRNGAFENFNYLLKRKVLKSKDINRLKLLTARDKDGYALLHCAAAGGSKDILKALREATPQIKIDDTTYGGHTVLHIACKHKHLYMCAYLLSDENNANLLLNKNSNQGWNAAHFAAMGGNIAILELLVSKEIDIKSETKNGLNVLQIACIHKHTELCKHLVKGENSKTLMNKSDAHGWTIAHFTAMIGDNGIFDLIKGVNNVKTHRRKTILHICCEHGHFDFCESILKSKPNFLYDVDDEEWNALHYAAKGGNRELFEKMEITFRESKLATTDDGKTVLHIACINNQVGICQYICSQKSYHSIINKKTTINKWTAAHYVAVEIREDGSEEKLIKILLKGGLDLKLTTVDGYTVLGIACEHRNKTLIEYLVKRHSYLLDIKRTKLKEVAEATNDEEIISKINNAIAGKKETNVE